MTVIPIPVGEMQTNCYLVYEQPQDAVLIDPGAQAADILQVVRQKGAVIRAVFLTHAHFDHMMAAEEVKKACQAPLLVHGEERQGLEDGMLNLSLPMTGQNCCVKADRFLSDGEVVEAGSLRLRVWHTPGHTRGSCCYELEQARVLFSGDTLFYHSYGRTDFPGGSEEQMQQSVSRLLAISGDEQVYPGHGPATTLAEERRCNPLR